jgi:hypothetical protein
MRTLGRKSLLVMFTGLFLVAALIYAGPAQATWYWTHGNSGHVQNKDALADPQFEWGWGLDIIQKPGTSNWVHFAVPTLGSKGVRYIKLIFLTYSADAWISEIHVYNGSQKIKEFKGHWTGGHNPLTLNIGSIQPITASLGISVKINAGVESMDHRVVFGAVGANFVNLPSP